MSVSAPEKDPMTSTEYAPEPGLLTAILNSCPEPLVLAIRKSKVVASATLLSVMVLGAAIARLAVMTVAPDALVIPPILATAAWLPVWIDVSCCCTWVANWDSCDKNTCITPSKDLLRNDKLNPVQVLGLMFELI